MDVHVRVRSTAIAQWRYPRTRNRRAALQLLGCMACPSLGCWCWRQAGYLGTARCQDPLPSPCTSWYLSPPQVYLASNSVLLPTKGRRCQWLYYGPHHGGCPRATHTLWDSPGQCSRLSKAWDDYSLSSPQSKQSGPSPHPPAQGCAWETGIRPAPPKQSPSPLPSTRSCMAAGTKTVQPPPSAAGPSLGSSIAQHSQRRSSHLLTGCCPARSPAALQQTQPFPLNTLKTPTVKGHQQMTASRWNCSS